MSLPADLDPVYVYKLSGSRYTGLCAWWSFYEGTQHDHCRTDWHGRERANRPPYLSDRVREKGFAANGGGRSNHDDRRPNVPMGLGARVVDRYTETTCGRPASLGVVGDTDGSAAYEALNKASDFWDAVSELVTIAGATGSSAILPVIMEDGRPSHEVFRPQSLYIRRWADRTRWIPEEVIHQIEVQVEAMDPKTREVSLKTMVRTRAWTPKLAIRFKDREKGGDAEKEPLELDDGEDAVIEHGWGRCPIVWHQNVRNSEGPEGQPDARTTANLEISDMADKVASHAVKATRANTEPTVVRGDRDVMFHLHPTIAKGVGNEIRHSEAGKVYFLETNGESVKMAWDAVDRLTLTFLRNTNCVVYDIDLAMAGRGSGDSGEALMQRSQSMQKRCNRKRVALAKTIEQVGGMWLSKMRAIGISTQDDPKEGTLVLPARCYKIEARDEEAEGEEHEAEEFKERSRTAAAGLLLNAKDPGEVLGWSDLEPQAEAYEPHKVGKGSSLEIRWPPYAELTPAQIQAYLGALSTATGSKAVLSQQTGIELATVALGMTDAAQEKRRLLEEKRQGLSQIQAVVSASPDPGGDAEDEGADAADGAEDDGETEDAEVKPGEETGPRGTTAPP
jgi:hypothetical protein